MPSSHEIENFQKQGWPEPEQAPTMKHCPGIYDFSNYGYKITSAVQNKNIFGVQFHPEKSQTGGMKLIRNFINSIFIKKYIEKQKQQYKYT